MILACLVLVACYGNALSEDFTLEMFVSDVGLPYTGEWVCFDDALYVYLPAELTKEEITEEMQAKGIIANYYATVELGFTLHIQIVQQGRKDSLEAIQREFEEQYAQPVCITINGVPVVAAFTGNELYAEALMVNMEAYLMIVEFSSEHEETSISNEMGMYMYEMLYSISGMPLEMDHEKVGSGTYQPEQTVGANM